MIFGLNSGGDNQAPAEIFGHVGKLEAGVIKEMKTHGKENLF
jgi:hypothetical protein